MFLDFSVNIFSVIFFFSCLRSNSLNFFVICRIYIDQETEGGFFLTMGICLSSRIKAESSPGHTGKCLLGFSFFKIIRAFVNLCNKIYF